VASEVAENATANEKNPRIEFMQKIVLGQI